MANLLVRFALADPGETAGRAFLAVAIAADLAILTLLRDRPVARWPMLIWAALIAAQGSAASTVAHPFGDFDFTLELADPLGPRLALLAAGVIVIATFALRRGSFEAGLMWVLVACTAAFGGWSGPHQATLYFASAELVLLLSLIEDSYRLAYHDELTGLPGRRALEEAMRTLHDSFTIAMVDVDRFKKFNDRHGHDAGDQALRMVADEIGAVGGGGRAYRFGGEEFAILFSGRGVAEVRSILEALRKAIATRKFALRAPDRPRAKPEKPKTKSRPPGQVTVSVSIGIADSNPRRATAAAVLRAADRALYRAKNAGRNRVVAAGDRL